MGILTSSEKIMELELHYHTASLVAFGIYLKLQECVSCCSASMLRSLHQVLKREAVSRSIILKISLLCFFFFFFTVGCRAWIIWVFGWCKKCFTNVSFKNKFLFP
jgi:hypothetical protein